MGGVFCKKWKMGFFVKHWTFPQRSKVQFSISIFSFYILLFWGVRTHPTHPPAYGLVGVQNAENGVILGHPKSSAMTAGDSIERIRLLFDFNRNSASTCTVFEI